MECPKCQTNNPADSKFCKECAMPLPEAGDSQVPFTKTIETASQELTTGSIFAGRYQIIEELGKGGMGKVYRALDKELDEEVALKLVRPEISSDKKTIERFSNELKLARKIAHKNVGRMYELMEDKGIRFITMEYIPGEDLKSMIRMSGQLGIGTAVNIAKQTCEGLAEAHKLGIIHRDLKPSNIIIDKAGSARIMDFGIARSLSAKGITGAGVTIGTPEYMSPEQVEGKEVDQRSDVYSLGIILYEMLSGRLPFEAETPFAVGMKQKGEVPEDPQKHNPRIPDDLSRIVLKCLEKDKEHRFQSAGEVRSELENIEKGIPTTEREIPKKKPLTSREITVTFGVRKFLIPVVIVAALIVAAIIIWQLLPPKEVIPVPLDRPSLAVMYFKNNTGDKNLDHWRTMLSNLLIADFTQSKYIRVLGEDKLFNILSKLNQLEAETYSSEVLEQVAVQGRVNHILQGAFAKAGDEFRINVMLQDASTGELVGSESVAGKGEESVFSMVDELTKRIKVNFDLSQEEIASDIDREVGKITTSSPEAFRYYNEGRKCHYLEDYRRSIEWMQKALEIDPEFAMAYRGMSVSYNNLLMFSEARKYLQKAFELSDKLSDRERYLIEGEFFRESEKTYPKAIEAYTNLLSLYPEDSIGNTNLGLLYMNIEQWNKAIERYEVLIQNKDESFFPYTNIAEAYRAKGLYEKSREVLEYYLENFQDSSAIRIELDLHYLLQGKHELAFIELDNAISLYPDNVRNLVQKGVISHCSGDFTAAENAYLKILETKELGYHLYARTVLGTLNLLKGKFKDSRNQHKQGIELAEKLGDSWWKLVFHTWLAYNYLKSDRPEEALIEYDRGWNSAKESMHQMRWQRRMLYFKGWAQVGMQSMDDAQRTANILKDMVEQGMNSKEIRLYHHLMGMIELERKNYSKAIEYFEKSKSLLPFPCGLGPFINDQALFAGPLALAYYQAGELDKAQKEYERIITIPTGILYWSDIYAKSFYMLAKIYEQKGWQGKAIEHYKKFLDLWKDSDPGIEEVQDAKKRVTELTEVTN